MIPRENFDAAVLDRAMALLFRNAVLGQVATILVATLLVFVGWEQRPLLAGVWWLLMVSIALWRIVVARQYQIASGELKRGSLWAPRVMLGVSVASAAWTGATMIFMWHAPPEQQALVAFMVAGVVAGAVPILASLPLALRIFAIPPVATLMFISFIQAESRVQWGIGLCAVLFLPTILKSSQLFYDAVDRSVRRSLEQEALAGDLALARDAALAASRAKDEFLATVSHEIRTPMNGVLGMTSLLQQTQLDNEQREFVGIIKKSADGLMDIINDILDFSRLDTGQLGLRAEPFLLEDLLQSLSALVEPKAKEKGLGFSVVMAPGVPTQLVGDAGRLRQVLVNLAGNAVKFTDRGEVSVAVAVAADPARPAVGAAKIRFEIRDTGAGIPRDKRDKLFQPFSQVDGSSTRRHGGTGLGLVISRRLVELMGGEIGFDSEEGRGSTFWFTVVLPLPEEVVIS